MYTNGAFCRHYGIKTIKLNNPEPPWQYSHYRLSVIRLTLPCLTGSCRFSQVLSRARAHCTVYIASPGKHQTSKLKVLFLWHAYLTKISSENYRKICHARDHLYYKQCCNEHLCTFFLCEHFLFSIFFLGHLQLGKRLLDLSDTLPAFLAIANWFPKLLHHFQSRRF